MPIPEIFGSDIWDFTLTLNFSIYLFMSTLANESLLENIYDEVWEEFRISNKLTDDQLNELCWANESGTLLAIETETNKRFEDMCQ